MLLLHQLIPKIKTLNREIFYVENDSLMIRTNEVKCMGKLMSRISFYILREGKWPKKSKTQGYSRLGG